MPIVYALAIHPQKAGYDCLPSKALSLLLVLTLMLPILNLTIINSINTNAINSNTKIILLILIFTINVNV